MEFAAVTAGLVAWIGAALASLCCLLPLAVIVLGVGSGAFMATTMQYRWLLVPAGVVGIVAGFALYVRERRRCDALACRMAGRRTTLALLIVASLWYLAMTSVLTFGQYYLERYFARGASRELPPTPLQRFRRILFQCHAPPPFPAARDVATPHAAPHEHR